MGIDNNSHNQNESTVGLIDASNTPNHNSQHEAEKMQQDLHLDNHLNQQQPNDASTFSQQFLFNKDTQPSESPIQTTTTASTNKPEHIEETATKTPTITDLLHKLNEPSSILSSSSSSSCVNSSGIGSTDLSPHHHHHHDYDLSRSPSSDTFIPSRQKRDGSAASQASTHSVRYGKASINTNKI